MENICKIINAFTVTFKFKSFKKNLTDPRFMDGIVYNPQNSYYSFTQHCRS